MCTRTLVVVKSLGWLLLIEALQGNLPSTLTTLGLIIVIAGVATVTTPRAEAAGA